MRILFLAAANSIHTVRWVNSLADRGHDVHLAYNYNQQATIDTLNEKVTQHQLKFSGKFGYYLNSIELKRIFKKIDPDIVNAHYASGYGTLARISKLKPLILSVWGSDVYDFPFQNSIKMKTVKKNLMYADYVASTSISMAKHIQENLNYGKEIGITPFGVDIEKFKKNKIEKKEFVIGIVKTLEDKYGIDYIIKGYKLLLNRLENEKIEMNTKLHIYGKGSKEKELQNLSDVLNISSDVIFKGYIPNDEVPKAINEMDIFCLGSVVNESFGVAAVEAMACQVPVIATDASGFKEVITDSVTGFIIPQRNEQSIADKMYELLFNNELRDSMGINGRKKVVELYDWNENVKTMELLYEKIKVRNC